MTFLLPAEELGGALVLSWRHSKDRNLAQPSRAVWWWWWGAGQRVP